MVRRACLANLMDSEENSPIEVVLYNSLIVSARSGHPRLRSTPAFSIEEHWLLDFKSEDTAHVDESAIATRGLTTMC